MPKNQEITLIKSQDHPDQVAGELPRPQPHRECLVLDENSAPGEYHVHHGQPPELGRSTPCGALRWTISAN